jgi:hypothetical protein
MCAERSGRLPLTLMNSARRAPQVAAEADGARKENAGARPAFE